MINITNLQKTTKKKAMEEDSIENMITTAEIENMLSTEAVVIAEVEEVEGITIIMGQEEIIITMASIDRIEVGEVEEEEILEGEEESLDTEEIIEVKEIIEEVEEEVDITKIIITITNKIKITRLMKNQMLKNKTISIGDKINKRSRKNKKNR